MKQLTNCFFVSDLHGREEKFIKLFSSVRNEKPDIVFMGGDLLPSFYSSGDTGDFIRNFIGGELYDLKMELADCYPSVFLIMGNDDPRIYEEAFISMEKEKLINYIHLKKKIHGSYNIYGYSCIPPSPFMLKDWEKYDVSRYADPGCIHPTEGCRSVDTREQIEFGTIQKDLQKLCPGEDLSSSIFLFHSPPYGTSLDRAALDGKMIDYVPLDVHVGSIAIKRFIEECSPYITLHGHVHEASSITGKWKEKTDDTWSFTAAWDGPELALVKFHAEKPWDATRHLL